jgi:hypothetical protein
VADPAVSLRTRQRLIEVKLRLFCCRACALAKRTMLEACVRQAARVLSCRVQVPRESLELLRRERVVVGKRLAKALA